MTGKYHGNNAMLGKVVAVDLSADDDMLAASNKLCSALSKVTSSNYKVLLLPGDEGMSLLLDMADFRLHSF